jgi:hypothetical protein
MGKLKGWFELQPYQYQGFSRVRQARFCTSIESNVKEMEVKATSLTRFK